MKEEIYSKIDDTFAEGFEGFYTKLIVTAEHERVVKSAAKDSTTTPATVIGRTEAGIEKWLSEEETPDGRKGALLQFWGSRSPEGENLEEFEKELSYRIRQDILVKPFTSIFDGLEDSSQELDMMDRVGHCGDGYEWVEEKYGRKIITVPIMVPDFEIEKKIGLNEGILGGNFWYFCGEKDTVVDAGERALEAIRDVDGVVAPFDIVSAGSKPETNYPEIGPTTNHPYCPSLKDELEDSKVPEDVNYIPEIVINGESMEAVKKGMKRGIKSVLEFEDVKRVSAGNYDGNLGNYKIPLKKLF